MSTYDKIAWLPLCGGLTGVGLVLSYLAGRSRGARAMLRGAAWSLLPLAAYLTGAIEMFWKIGSAIGDFATSFVFSPKVWSGIAVAGVALVLFVVTGGMRRRGAGGKKKKEQGADTRPGAVARPGAGTGALPGTTAVVPTAAQNAGVTGTRETAAQPVPDRQPKAKKKGRGGGDDDPDLKEVDDILRRHGIS